MVRNPPLLYDSAGRAPSRWNHGNRRTLPVNLNVGDPVTIRRPGCAISGYRRREQTATSSAGHLLLKKVQDSFVFGTPCKDNPSSIRRERWIVLIAWLGGERPA